MSGSSRRWTRLSVRSSRWSSPPRCSSIGSLRRRPPSTPPLILCTRSPPARLQHSAQIRHPLVRASCCLRWLLSRALSRCALLWCGRASRLEETHQIDEWCACALHLRLRLRLRLSLQLRLRYSAVRRTFSFAPVLNRAATCRCCYRRGYTEGADGAEGYDASLRVDVGAAVLITRLVTLK
jgi:hypothetical protein